MKIIRKVERDLLQARVKSINSLLGYNAKQKDLCRSQLASILSTSTINKFKELIDKVSLDTSMLEKDKLTNLIGYYKKRKEI